MEEQILSAEQATLGASLLNKSAFIYCIENLKAESFEEPKHRALFKKMNKLFKDGMECDLVTMASQFTGLELQEEVGGIFYLTTLAQSVPSINNIEHYVSIVRKNALQRSQRHLIEAVADNRLTIEQAIAKLDELGEVEIVDETFQAILRNTLTDTLKGTEHRFTISVFNKYLGGLDKGELLTIGGYTSQGKSDLAIQLGIDFCMQQKRVLYLSTEMLPQEIGRRILGNLGEINVMDIRKGILTSEQKEMMADISNKIGRAWNFNIKKVYEIEDVGKYVRKYEPEILILDYIQNLGGEDYKIATRNIKYLQSLTMAKEISTVCLSQLNRNKDEIREPKLTDLRDSGRIEECSNMVMFLYWKDRLKQENKIRIGGEPPEEVEVLIAKNRDGTIGRCRIHFYPEFARFEDILGREYQEDLVWGKK